LTGSDLDSSLVRSTNHILAIYPNSREKLDAAFRFLNDGLLNNEAVLLITDEITREDAIARMEKDYAGFDVLDLLERGVISIKSTGQCHLIRDSFHDSGTQIKWKKNVVESLLNSFFIENTLKKEKVSGLRAFGDTKSFFNKDKRSSNDKSPFSFIDNLVEYECSLKKHFPFPLKVICAYEEADIVQFNNLEFRSLLKHHGVFHKDSIKELAYPLQNSHIMLLYNNQQDLNDAYITYINEGLAQGQLCVFASVLLQNNDFLKDISSRIINFEENVQNENLMLVDMAKYYIQAMMDNLQEFDNLKNKLVDKVRNDKKRNDKHIRLIDDCSEFLFKNKHFEECVNLENWIHQKRFEGSVLCPYSKSLFDQFPYCYYLFRVFHSDDIVIDSRGNFLLDYVKNSQHQSKLISYMMKRMDIFNVGLNGE
jgi:archaellum biogenesis ATPase FlaH